MKKNIIIIISILVVLVSVVVIAFLISGYKNKPVINNQPSYTDAITDINNDLRAIDFGNLNNEFDEVDRDIQGL